MSWFSAAVPPSPPPSPLLLPVCLSVCVYASVPLSVLLSLSLSLNLSLRLSISLHFVCVPYILVVVCQRCLRTVWLGQPPLLDYDSYMSYFEYFMSPPPSAFTLPLILASLFTLHSLLSALCTSITLKASTLVPAACVTSNRITHKHTMLLTSR